MSKSPFRERRYRTEEVRAIVQRALGRNSEQSSGRPLTREELSTMLSDLGVSPQAAEQALEQTEPTTGVDSSDPDDVFGGPKRIVYEEEIEGELADERREDVVEIIREVMGDAGRVESLGRTVTWSPTPAANNQQRRLNVKVRVRDGRTRIRVDEDLSPVRFGAWFGFGFGGGLGLGGLAIAAGKAAHSAFVGVLTFALIVGANLLVAWVVTGAVSRRRRRDLKKLFEKVRQEVVRGTAVRPRVAAKKRVAESEGEGKENEAEEEEDVAEEEAASEERRPKDRVRR